MGSLGKEHRLRADIRGDIPVPVGAVTGRSLGPTERPLGAALLATAKLPWGAGPIRGPRHRRARVRLQEPQHTTQAATFLGPGLLPSGATQGREAPSLFVLEFSQRTGGSPTPGASDRGSPIHPNLPPVHNEHPFSVSPSISLPPSPINSGNQELL